MKEIFRRLSVGLALAAVPLLFVACGGGGGGSSSAAPQTGSAALSISDASTEDWDTIGVKILSITLNPQGGGTPVAVYAAPSPVPVTNLVQLDNLSEILSIPSIPAGTYTGATLTLSGNQGDVALVVASNPESGFAGTPGATIPSDHIKIQHTIGNPGSKTVPVNVTFESPVTIQANQTTPVDFEFDLSHPALIVDHVTASGTYWAVNFRGPVRHHPIRDIARMVLRHHYGTVASIASDSSSLTIDKDYPAYPATTPETAITSSQTLPILADSTNGTLFYDVDAKTHQTITSFAPVASGLTGKYVRVAARYQQNGTLVAVRMWASSDFNKVWVSPEGHVLHVDNTTPSAPVITVENENAQPVQLTVDSNTRIFFRTPEAALTDANPITNDPVGFVNSNNIVRGFKVHASVVDPLASPLVAQSLDIEIAKYDGYISSPTTSNFAYTRSFRMSSDNYTKTLAYISPTTPNGKDASGNVIDGFKWWNFTYPTLAETGANAIPDFVSATGGSVNFGGTTSPLKAWGISYCRWNDPAAPNAWAANWSVLLPVPVPLGTVQTPWSSNANGGSFNLVVPNGNSTGVTINLSSVSNSATLVYQVDNTAGVITISPEDLTSASGLAATAAALGTTGTPVKVYGIPQANGTLKAYVVLYFTGTTPTS